MKLGMALMVGAACAQPALVGPTSVRLPLMPAEPEGIAPKPPTARLRGVPVAKVSRTGPCRSSCRGSGQAR